MVVAPPLRPALPRAVYLECGPLFGAHVFTVSTLPETLSLSILGRTFVFRKHPTRQEPMASGPATVYECEAIRW